MSTPFPTSAAEVAALSVQEFAIQPPGEEVPAFNDICLRFAADPNRALVWLIRFHALNIWSARAGVGALSTHFRSAAWDAAASCELNWNWEFDPEQFQLALESIEARRSADEIEPRRTLEG